METGREKAGAGGGRSCVMAMNIKSFVRAGGLFPGGFTGLTLLIQQAADKFFHFSVPYSAVNLLLNLAPIMISFRFIGKKFTLYSCVAIVLTSILTDILPGYPITSDILLICVFGGLINGFAVSLCLFAGATSGGTDLSRFSFPSARERNLELHSGGQCADAWRRPAFCSAGSRRCIPSFFSSRRPRFSTGCTAVIKS